MAMAEEWFVRVEGKEYGPVELDALREWKDEGRLIPQNFVRRGGETDWIAASSVEELFPSAQAAVAADDTQRRRTFTEILAETFRIYGKGFPQFFALALLVAVPSLALKLSLAFVNYHEGQIISGTTRIASVLAMCALAAVLVSWPIFVAGLQFVAADAAAGRAIRLGEILRRAVNFWPRVARLCLFVYGSYFFWTAFPLLALLILAASPSLLSVLIAVLALVCQVYMAGRLFINFMFWQQSSTLGGHEAVDALRDSRELARSRTNAPRLQRPLYRGAIIASLWLVVLLVISAAVELPFIFARMQGITDLEQALAMLPSLVNAPAPDAMTIATYVLSSLVHAALRPLLGIAFVVLYFDARATR